MARIIEVYKRLTHRYVGSCSHLDQWSNSPIRIKILGGKFLHPYDLAVRDGHPNRTIDCSEGGESYQRVVLLKPRGISDKAVEQAIYGQFSKHGCSHDWDCCGCMSTSVELVKKGKHEWLMTLSYSYNY